MPKGPFRIKQSDKLKRASKRFSKSKYFQIKRSILLCRYNNSNDTNENAQVRKKITNHLVNAYFDDNVVVSGTNTIYNNYVHARVRAH